MNVLVGAKVSITSRKAQTTRHRITGIQTIENTQYVYVDTPASRPVTAMRSTRPEPHRHQYLTAADVILFVIEAGTFGPADKQVLDLLPSNVPCILVLNKADRNKDKTTLMPFAAEVASHHDFAAVVPVSAKQRFQLDRLQEKCASCPQNPPMFDEDDITDRSEKFLASEIVREKVFRFVGEELPYTSTVLIEKFEQEGNLRRVFAAILVERDTHKAMVIGPEGRASEGDFHPGAAGHGAPLRRSGLSGNLGQGQIGLGRQRSRSARLRLRMIPLARPAGCAKFLHHHGHAAPNDVASRIQDGYP
jgi:GTP-binding protein Era